MSTNIQTWYNKNVPDQKGKIFIITGANSGLGFHAARTIASKNGTVVLATRNIDAGKFTRVKISTEFSSADVHPLQLDLTDLNSIHNFVKEFKQKFNRLDLLLNNAGVMAMPYSKTKDNFEIQIGTNHFGHFALTALLFPILKTTIDSRIVSVSSALHKYGNIDFNDINWEKRNYKTWTAYCDSKIANLHFAFFLQKKIEEYKLNMKSVAAHPGWTYTQLQRNKLYANILSRLFAQKAEMGSLPLIYAAVGSDVSGGDFIGPDGKNEVRGFPKKVNSIPRAKDENNMNGLWEISEKLTGVKFEF